VSRVKELILLGLVVGLASAGCSGITGLWPKRIDTSKGKPGSQGTVVKIGGDGFNLGDIEQSSFAPQHFVDRVGEMLSAKRRPAAGRWIQRYPDVALSVLREMSGVRAATEVLVVIAEAHDRQCSRCGAEGGWSAVVLSRASHPQRFSDYETKRQQFMADVQNGRVEQALAQNLPAASQGLGDVLAIDAWRLQGIGLLLAERSKEAAETFQRTLQIAGNAHPYQAANVLLLLSDALRRSGDLEGNQNAWQSAVQLACDLAHGPIPVTDAVFWERAAYMRPVNLPWPQPVLRGLADLNVRFGIAPTQRDQVLLTSTAPAAHNEEAPIWIAIGHWRLGREESQAALVALKRAEVTTSDAYATSRLQLSQARALVRLGQQPAATAMLIHAASNNDPRLARPATALLGTIKLQQGAIQPGFNLLRRAVEEDPGFYWPERADAEADLGLAYLLMGDEDAGLHWLHVAQQGFEAAAQQEALLQCLENELAWLEQAKKKELAAAVRKRLESLQTF